MCQGQIGRGAGSGRRAPWPHAGWTDAGCADIRILIIIQKVAISQEFVGLKIFHLE